MTFTLDPVPWDLSKFVHLLWILLILVSWWNPCIHRGRASPAAPVLLCLQWPGSGLGSSPCPRGLLPHPAWLALAGADVEHDHRTVLPHVGKPRLQESHWLDLRWMCPSCVKTKKCRTSICLMLTHKMKNSCSLWSQLSSLNHVSPAEFLPVALGFLHNYYFSNTGLQLLLTWEMGSETDTYVGKVHLYWK